MIYTGFFCAYEYERTGAVAAAAKASYTKLSTGEKTFFHDVLPPLMMATGIGVLNELTYEVFVRRWVVISYCHCVELAQYQLKCEWKDEHKSGDFDVGRLNEGTVEGALVRFLRKFEGVVSNVPLETDTQFRARTLSRMKFGKQEVKFASRRAHKLRETVTQEATIQ